jgi:NAD(P)H-dependent FMN reductase
MINQNFIKPAVKIIAISGSLREGSYTRAALQVVLQGAAEYGAEVKLLDLREYNLVFSGMVDEQYYPEDVFTLRREVQQAQGIILGTPEYHGSFSGVLKNALDLMSFREIEGKMIGLVGVAGGALGAVNALNSLRNVGRHLHAWVLPQQVSIPQAHKVFDKEGNIQDEKIKSRLLDIGRGVAKFATLHQDIESPDIYQNVERVAV